MAKLLFREDWSSKPAARPVSQDHLSNPGLILRLHGPGSAGLKKSHHDEVPGDPYYIWSGRCEGPWALSLRHKGFFINFGDAGRVRFLSKPSGGHRLSLIVKPEDGDWLISDAFVESSDQWLEHEFKTPALSWRTLDIGKVQASGKVSRVSLGRIDAVGFTDLSAGQGSDACSRLAWIEVWGDEIARPSPAKA
jgi:hypothetical protein